VSRQVVGLKFLHFLTGPQLILPPSSRFVRPAQFTALVLVYRPHPSLSRSYETASLYLGCSLELEFVQRKSSLHKSGSHFWLFGTTIHLIHLKSFLAYTLRAYFEIIPTSGFLYIGIDSFSDNYHVKYSLFCSCPNCF
jgi:hypothetical protein